MNQQVCPQCALPFTGGSGYIIRGPENQFFETSDKRPSWDEVCSEMCAVIVLFGEKVRRAETSGRFAMMRELKPKLKKRFRRNAVDLV